MKFKSLITGICAAALLTACGDDSPPKTANGGACEVGSDCESGECWQALQGCFGLLGCATYTLTDGMCSLECEWDLETDDVYDRTQGTCAAGEWCLVYGDSPKICFEDCLEDGTCAREDYVCIEIDSHINMSACLPPDDEAREVNESMSLTTSEQPVLIKQ